MFHCEAVGLDFLDSAPVLLATNVTVNRPPDEVFAAFAHDPATWGEFFPGFDRSGYYHTPHSRPARRGLRVRKAIPRQHR